MMYFYASCTSYGLEIGWMMVMVLIFLSLCVARGSRMLPNNGKTYQKKTQNATKVYFSHQDYNETAVFPGSNHFLLRSLSSE